jgi:hypothetical protein
MKTWTQRACITIVVVLTSLILTGLVASADSLQLHDGRHFDGHYVGGTESVIAFLTEGSVQYFPTGDVLLVVFGNQSGKILGPLGQNVTPFSPMLNKAAACPNAHLRSGNAHSPKPSQLTGESPAAQSRCSTLRRLFQSRLHHVDDIVSDSVEHEIAD